MQVIINTHGHPLYAYSDNIEIVATSKNIKVGNPVETTIGDLNLNNSSVVNVSLLPEGWEAGSGWMWNGIEIIRNLEKISQQKDSQFLAEVSQIKQGYTEDEIKSWAKQEAEARGWTADNTYPTPLLDGIISQTQESKSTLAATIIVKADLYAAAFGAALGRKRA